MKANTIKIGSNRSFGIVFFIVFLIISLFPLIKGNDLRIWSLLISLMFLVLGLMNSSILGPLNKLWFKFGLLLGSIVSPIVMGIVFFCVITPIAIIMKILGKDLLNLKFSNVRTYWIKREKNIGSMKRQF